MRSDCQNEDHIWGIREYVHKHMLPCHVQPCMHAVMMQVNGVRADRCPASVENRKPCLAPTEKLMRILRLWLMITTGLPTSKRCSETENISFVA